ncbi:hypothetical protein SAMN05518865_10351 [Duganella sp. CF458]|nr:hypothetical protein SAMN05518865_10351 [Duganella sp. CF458]
MRCSGIGLLVAAVLLPGCASFYQQPGEGEKSAQLSVRIPPETGNFLSRNKSRLVDVSGFADAQCTPGTGNGRVVNLGNMLGVSKNARVAADRRLYLQIFRIETTYKTLNGAQNTLNALLKVPGGKILEMEAVTERCIRVMSFIPEAGKSYAMQVEGTVSECVVSLADVSTDQAPPDLQAHELEGACIPSR